MVDNHQKATQPQRDHIFRNCIYRFNNFSLSLSKFRALRNLYIIKKTHFMRICSITDFNITYSNC